jgi:hypothetical protein
MVQRLYPALVRGEGGRRIVLCFWCHCIGLDEPWDGVAGNSICELTLHWACHHRQEKDPAGAFAAGFVSSRAISPGYMHASLVKDSANFPLSLQQCFDGGLSKVENEHCDGRTIACLRR